MKRRGFLKRIAVVAGLAVIPGASFVTAKPTPSKGIRWETARFPSGKIEQSNDPLKIKYSVPKPQEVFIPELWAREGLAILEENMVMSRLMHRDFGDAVHYCRDTVNTDRPNDRLVTIGIDTGHCMLDPDLKTVRLG